VSGFTCSIESETPQSAMTVKITNPSSSSLTIGGSAVTITTWVYATTVSGSDPTSPWSAKIKAKFPSSETTTNSQVDGCT